MKKLILPLLILCLSCNSKNTSKEAVDTTYKDELNTFRKKLNENRIHYLELNGLFKINEGENTFGKVETDFVIPSDSIENTIGTIIKNDSIINIEVFENVSLTNSEKESITSKTLALDEYGSSEMLYHNNINFQVITRSESNYLRVWDKNNPEINKFKGFEFYDLNKNYVVKGNFEYFNEEKIESVRSQLGVNANTNFIGKVSFVYEGETHSLDIGEGGFIMVSDATSGNETYGGGRYMSIDLPKENGEVEIDFNKLYNPPCSFSKYTTCLYPPRQNVLPFKIEAGETITKKKS